MGPGKENSCIFPIQRRRDQTALRSKWLWLRMWPVLTPAASYFEWHVCYQTCCVQVLREAQRCLATSLRTQS